MKLKWIFVIASIGILLRLLLIWSVPEIGNPLIMDAQNYDRIAVNISKGSGFALYGVPTAFVAPLYPFFLSLIYTVFGHNYWVVKILQAIIGGLTSLIVFFIGKELFNYWTGFFSSLFVAVHPELIGISTFIYTETLNIFLLSLFVLFFIKGLKNNDDKKYYLLSGLFLGLSTLCKGVTLLFPFLLLCFFIVDRGLRKKLANLFPFVCVFVVTITPWTIRNYYHFKTFLPIATGGGEALWTGNYIPFDGEFRYEQTRAKIEELTKGLTPIERDKKLMEEAKKTIFENPKTFLKLFVKKIYRFWLKVYEDIPRGKKRTTNIPIKTGLAFIHYPILILALLGIFKSNRGGKEIWIILSLLFYFTLVYAITFAVPRYRLPVMPYAIVFSSVGVLKVVHFLNKKGENVVQ